MGHIPTRNFNHTIGMNERWSIIDKHKDKTWDIARAYNSDRKKITKSAIKITEVLKNKIKLDLFPCIHKIACKGFDISGGTYAFSMYGKDGKQYYFDSHAKDYKSLNNDYLLEGDLILVGRLR